MTTCIIFYSATGNTRILARAAAKATGADLIEVKDRADYSRAMMYIRGIPRARKGEEGEIDPAEIDVSGYDLVAVGTPVWAFKPTPAANAIVSALRNGEGKQAIAFATSGGMPGDTLEMLTDRLRGRGMDVVGSVHVPERDLSGGKGAEPLIRLIRSASGA
ncbi:flavodoxin family protein [Methanofollis fontis]|uniref:ArsR family transcriptional regulator n=1 Tax=Methanofollis fontis TaxID=2052832 RepID=A0A483CQP9_9EURY|nr:flavodoxin [Methanofollis fontis]TAJ45445.1 ArsR family transcriptional regulator [Methanofollis fontis]